MAAKVDPFFVTANYVEAALWGVIGVGFILYAVSKSGGRTSFIAAIAFLLFAFSDVIETRTGAWWRPWWLLVLKGTCVATFAMLLANHYLGRRRAIPDTARPQTSSPASR